jgi:hypothetical protein
MTNFVDASQLTGTLDRRASEWTPQSLHQIFLRHGCTIIREAVPHTVLKNVKNLIATAYENTADLHVYDQDIRKASAGRFSGFELVDDPLIQDFLDRLYDGQTWRRDSVTARRVNGAEINQGWQRPLPLHLDSQYHGFEFTTNFWIPFQDCGVETPALQLVPVDYIRTRKYSGFTSSPLWGSDKWNCGYFIEGVFDPSAIVEEFGAECFLRPKMRKGDAIVASNWVIHGTYATPNMRSGRMNAEVRFIGSAREVRGIEGLLEG